VFIRVHRWQRTKGAPAGAPSVLRRQVPDLAEVLVCDLGEIEHRDLAPAAEERAELLVGIDGATVPGVLQPVSLDVGPELTDDLGTGHWAVADHGSEFCAGLQGFHECGIWCALPA
jgi:hypothetical protein